MIDFCLVLPTCPFGTFLFLLFLERSQPLVVFFFHVSLILLLVRFLLYLASHSVCGVSQCAFLYALSLWNLLCYLDLLIAPFFSAFNYLFLIFLSSFINFSGRNHLTSPPFLLSSIFTSFSVILLSLHHFHSLSCFPATY